MDNIKSTVDIVRKSGTKVLRNILRRSRRYRPRCHYERNDSDGSTDPSRNIEKNVDNVEEPNNEDQISYSGVPVSSKNINGFIRKRRYFKVINGKICNNSDDEIAINENVESGQIAKTDSAISDLTNSKSENIATIECMPSTSQSCNAVQKKQHKYCIETEIYNRRKYGFNNKMMVRNIYEPVVGKKPKISNQTRRNIIQKKMFVTMDDPLRSRRSPLTTPICKSSRSNRIERSLDTYTVSQNRNSDEFFFSENRSPIISLACGSTDQLDISFSSSYGSNDSLSELVSDEDEDEEQILDEPETHFAIFDLMRTKCREHLSNMSEISKKLKELRANRIVDNIEELLQTEKELLIASESYLNCMSNITNCKYTIQENNSEQVATIVITDIMIPMRIRFESYCNNYYVCIVRSEKKMLATKCIKAERFNSKHFLMFEDELVFEELNEDFCLEINVYEITFCEKKKLFRRTSLEGRPVDGLRFRPLTAGRKGNNTILHTAFEQCGAYQISLRNMRKNIVYNNFPSSSLTRHSEIRRFTTKLVINTTKKGYLNFGQRHATKDIIIWNVKYVSLEGCVLKIYNSSQDADSKVKPLAQIDLRNISKGLVAHTCYLKYCLELDTVCDERDVHFRFHYSYFLRANTLSDFENWFNEINHVVKSLQQWNLLDSDY